MIPDGRLNGVYVQASVMRDWAVRSGAVEHASIVCLGSRPSIQNGSIPGVDLVEATAVAMKTYLTENSPSFVLLESLFSLTLNSVPGWTAVLTELGLPYVVRIHEMIPMEGAERMWTRAAPPPATFFPNPAQRVAVVVPTQTALKHYDLLIHKHRNVAVIPIGIDVDRVPEPLPPTTADILQIGTLYPRKGPLHTINAFAKISSRYPQSSLCFVGPLTAHVEVAVSACKLHGIYNRVQFVGSQEDAFGYYQSAALSTLHSESESTPTVAIESMLSGRPFTGSAVGGTTELLAGTSCERYLFEYGDTNGHARAMETILSDPYRAYMQTLADRSVLAGRHDIAVVGPRMIALGQSLV